MAGTPWTPDAATLIDFVYRFWIDKPSVQPAAGASIAAARLRDPQWGPHHIDGAAAVEGFHSLGVDVDLWR